jgi:energy-coupling factor transporter ATP-binding protein EcfA2
VELIQGGILLNVKAGVAGAPDFMQVDNFPSGRINTVGMSAALRLLSETLYVGPFRNVINVGGERNYFDLPIGTEFITQWANSQEGPLAQAKIVQSVVDDIEEIFGIARLEIKATGDRRYLHATINRERFDISELGSGLAQFVAALYVAKTNSPAYLLIDEPEANLHPSLQLDFLTRLAASTRRGLLFATHSVGLARSAANRIYSVHKPSIEAPSRIRPYEALPDVATFLGELSYSGSYDLGFSKLLFVEGVTDVTVFEELLKKRGVAHKVTILSLGGSGGIGANSGKVLLQVKQITPNVFAVIDSERRQPDALGPPQRAFADACKKLDVKHLIMERRSIECYFPEYAVQAVFGESAHSLGPYDSLPSFWRNRKQDNWRVALETKWDDIANTDLGRFLDLLVEAPDMIDGRSADSRSD